MAGAGHLPPDHAMDTQLIEMFVVLARRRSFTRAAEELGMPQPHLSRLIRRLEDIVGAELIDRSTFAQRTYYEAQRTMRYACEIPAELDQRLGLYARALQAGLR